MRTPGRKRRPGRPTLPPGEVRTVQLGVHVTADEAELIRRAIERLDAKSFSDWARRLLVEAARRAVAQGKTARTSNDPSRDAGGQGPTQPRSKKDT